MAHHVPPATVVIGPHHYVIDYADSTGRLLRSEEARGDSRPDYLHVRLDMDRPHTAIAETLVHELLHCAWHQTSLRASENLNDHKRRSS